jgi:hypothetical protein
MAEILANDGSAETNRGDLMKIAILDDYQNVALKMADWSVLAERAEITVFNDHVTDPSGVVERLLPFDVIDPRSSVGMP